MLPYFPGWRNWQTPEELSHHLILVLETAYGFDDRPGTITCAENISDNAVLLAGSYRKVAEKMPSPMRAEMTI